MQPYNNLMPIPYLLVIFFAYFSPAYAQSDYSHLRKDIGYSVPLSKPPLVIDTKFPSQIINVSKTRKTVITHRGLELSLIHI